MGENLNKSEVIYPPSYDKQGNSRYYNIEAISRSLTCAKLDIIRPLRFGNLLDLQLVDVAQPDMPELPSPRYALKEYIRTSFGERKTPVYIFDDHNHAFFAWSEAYKEGHINKGSQLWHFDDHDDSKKIKYFPLGENWSLAEAARAAQSTEFDSFIHPAILLGLVKEVFWVQHYQDRRHDNETEWGIANEVVKITNIPVSPTDSRHTIVDIDVDYFDYLLRWKKNLDSTVKALRCLMESAGVVTIATSPGFLDQKKAIEIVKILLS